MPAPSRSIEILGGLTPEKLVREYVDPVVIQVRILLSCPQAQRESHA